MKKRAFAILFGLVAAAASALGTFAWVTKTNDDPLKMLPGVDPSKASGTIITAGSSTVFPVSELIAAMFKEDGFKGQVIVDSIGSGAGFDRFCTAGETDIANASVPIKQTQVDAAKAIGRTPVEFRLGTDALAVVVSKSNTWVSDISQSELKLAFSTAVYWSDVRPSWPKKEIKRYIPGTDSGTFDYFVEHLYKKDRKPILAAKNTQMSEDDNVLVRGVSGDPYAIGFFGFAYYLENRAKLKVLSVDGVEANAANVDKGTYPLARPIFIYSDAKIMNDKPQVAAFIAYYLTYVDEALKEVGYFPAPEADRRKARQNWLDAVKGRY
ncbi:MAG: PstS family phosphate ABC transporter substrate-binding protein [Spirochaetales bacterium]|nr:PstS family phosphate ABC transporter substrate-binding protein [Spirochaetales bacterium]MBP7264039.1 PstS family phosphate ABC transporter substrate-binding protein [Spirochaetia bacterium]